MKTGDHRGLQRRNSSCLFLRQQRHLIYIDIHPSFLGYQGESFSFCGGYRCRVLGAEGSDEASMHMNLLFRGRRYWASSCFLSSTHAAESLHPVSREVIQGSGHILLSAQTARNEPILGPCTCAAGLKVPKIIAKLSFAVFTGPLPVLDHFHFHSIRVSRNHGKARSLAHSLVKRKVARVCYRKEPLRCFKRWMWWMSAYGRKNTKWQELIATDLRIGIDSERSRVRRPESPFSFFQNLTQGLLKKQYKIRQC